MHQLVLLWQVSSLYWEAPCLTVPNQHLGSGCYLLEGGSNQWDNMVKIAKAMTAAGKLLSAHQVSTAMDEQPMKQTRMLKFGELQVEVTPDKANIGAVIALIFGVLSWQISQGIQSIPDGSLQYANDNALMLAKSLRVALLLHFYSSTVLSAFTSLGLLLLGRQLKSKEK